LFIDDVAMNYLLNNLYIKHKQASLAQVNKTGAICLLSHIPSEGLECSGYGTMGIEAATLSIVVPLISGSWPNSVIITLVTSCRLGKHYFASIDKILRTH
jgi:hypothetical protein